MVEEDNNRDNLQTALRTSEWRRFRRVFFSRGVVIMGIVIALALLLSAVFAPALAPYDPYQTSLRSRLQKPSSAHLLGTDAVGRDILTRIIYGTRTTLLICFTSIGLAAFLGMTLGLIAGYFGGWTHTLIMRLIDALMAFPMILLALVIAAMLGGGAANVIIALGVSLMPGYARLMCAQVMSVKESDYVVAVRSIGAGSLRTMLRHVVPNCFPPLIVLITMMLGATILAEAGLSFLGIGIEPPAAAWGSMVSDGRAYLTDHPLLSFAPGLAIMLVVFAFNMIGDGLRDALDPRLRGVL